MCIIYIINLPSSIERYARMKRKLADIGSTNFEFISAIDGAELTHAEISKYYQLEKSLNISGREFSRGEIGCALSHQKAYQTLLASNNQQALILEDDVDLLENTPEILTAANKWISHHEPRVLLLSPLRAYCTKPKKMLTSKHALVDVKKAWGGVGYIINKSAAKQLISINRKIWLMADDWNEYRRHSGITLKGLEPWIIQATPEIKSILEASRKNKRLKKNRTLLYRVKKIRENVLMKITEYLFWRPFKGYKSHKPIITTIKK